MHIELTDTALTSESLQTIATFAPHIYLLNLQYCGQLDNAAFKTFSKLERLRHLELYGPFLVRREAWLEFLAQKGPQLTSLRLRETPRFDRSCMDALVAHCPQLEQLGLAQIGCLDDDGARALFPLTRLTYLDVSQPGISAPGVPPASLHDDSVVPLLQAVGARLSTLALNKNAKLSDRVVREGLVPTCRALRHVSFDEMANVTGEAWTELFSACTDLERVSLSRCAQFNDGALGALAHGSRSTLRVLSVNSVDELSSAAFAQLAEVAPPLEVLDVGFVRSVDDGVLAQLADHIPTLQTLYIFGCNQVVRCPSDCMHLTQASFRTDRFTIVGRERPIS